MNSPSYSNRRARFPGLLSLDAAVLGCALSCALAPALAQVAQTPPPATAPAPGAAPTPAPLPAGAAPAAAPAPAPAKLKPEQLEAIVAPVALYPDSLLVQVLVASTYPLEIMEAQQWSAKNASLKGDALLQAAQKQSWDASVQSLVVFPDVMKRMTENISWTSDLGDAFLAQQTDVMDAVQRLRLKAKQSGKLTTTEQQTVTTKVVEKQTVVVIEPAKTEVVYVPVYDPALVWGPPMYYPYPPIYYPPPPPAGAMLVSFGVGMMVGAAIHGGWGYNAGWGHSHGVVVVNHHNTVVHNHNNYNNINNVNRGNSNWQHDASHRGNAAYKSSDVAKKYGGQAGASQRPANSPRPDTRPSGGVAPGPRNDLAGGRPQTGTSDGRGDFGSDRGGYGGDRGGVSTSERDFGGDRGGGGFDRDSARSRESRSATSSRGSRSSFGGGGRQAMPRGRRR